MPKPGRLGRSRLGTGRLTARSLEPQLITGTPPVVQSVDEGDTAGDALVSWGSYTPADGYTLDTPVREMNNGASWVAYNAATTLDAGTFQVRETIATVEDATIERTFTSAEVEVAPEIGENAALWGGEPATWGNEPATWGAS
jgi:hypothetical protein